MEYKKHVFSIVERNMFLNIIKKYIKIIDYKKTDSHSLQLKNAVWNKITREYNASPHASYQVVSKQLRRLWMNLKQRQREKLGLTIERQNRSSVNPSSSDSKIVPDMSQVTESLLVGVNETIDSEILPEIKVTKIKGTVKNSAQLSPPVCTSTNNNSTEESDALDINSTYNSCQHRRDSACVKASILQNEYNDRKIRADELHLLEIELMRERVREARAKADLAEAILEKQRSSECVECKPELF